jgi:hypothetical protein
MMKEEKARDLQRQSQSDIRLAITKRAPYLESPISTSIIDVTKPDVRSQSLKNRSRNKILGTSALDFKLFVNA